jgi:hypothetical protein
MAADMAAMPLAVTMAASPASIAASRACRLRWLGELLSRM